MDGTTVLKHKFTSLTDEEIEELRDAFNIFDTDCTGRIDPKEMKAAMQSLGFDRKCPMVYQIIMDMNQQARTKLDFEDFLGFISSVLGDRKSRTGLQKIFALFDDDKTGTITLRNLRRIATELGETVTDDELKESIRRADLNGDGEIGFEDFFAVMTRD